MPEIRCPRCQTKLSVPRKLLGTPVNCPRCAQPFMASAIAGSDSSSLSSSNLVVGNASASGSAGTSADLLPPSAMPHASAMLPPTGPLPPAGTGSGSVAMPAAPAAANYAFPPGMAAPTTSAAPTPTAAPTITSVPLPAVPASSLLPPGAVPSAMPTGSTATTTVPKAIPLPPAASQPTATQTSATGNPALRHNPWKNDAAAGDISRSAQGPKVTPPPTPPVAPAPANDAATAKVIRAVASPDILALSSDGKLTGLQLSEEIEKPRRNFSAWKSNPAIIALLFCLSMGSTVAMLLIEPSAGRTAPATRAEVRDKLKPFYEAKPNAALQPYQLDLRRALQAHSSGDYKTEQDLYRKVLKRLQAEKPRPYSNLTGSMERDDELIECLSILVRKD